MNVMLVGCFLLERKDKCWMHTMRSLFWESTREDTKSTGLWLNPVKKFLLVFLSMISSTNFLMSLSISWIATLVFPTAAVRWLVDELGKVGEQTSTKQNKTEKKKKKKKKGQSIIQT